MIRDPAPSPDGVSETGAECHHRRVNDSPRRPLPLRVLRRVWGVLSLVVTDRRKPPRMPLGNLIPNSDGNGGRVISSGHPGGH